MVADIRRSMRQETVERKWGYQIRDRSDLNLGHWQ